MMQHRRRLVAAASAVALFAAIVAAPAPATEPTAAPTIVYSEMYLMLIAAYPAGWVMDSCYAVLEVTGGDGSCLDTLQLEYFYPDGTFGRMPWHADAASPTGWSVEADPCASLPLDDWDVWAWYVDWANGWYYETGPDLTDEQVALYTQCWGWWF